MYYFIDTDIYYYMYGILTIGRTQHYIESDHCGDSPRYVDDPNEFAGLTRHVPLPSQFDRVLAGRKDRCRANLAHMRQSRPDSGLGV